MDNTNNIASFKAINEEIKTALNELDQHISAHPYFDNTKLGNNNDLFIELLDKLLDARCTIEELKKYHY